jgi:hypothetical protein
MNKSITNIIVLIGLSITAVAGYFVFSQNSSPFLETSFSDQQTQDLIASSQLFIDRSRTLSAISMDMSIFADPVFNSLKSYSPPPSEFPIGRSNPFKPVSATAPVQ